MCTSHRPCGKCDHSQLCSPSAVIPTGPQISKCCRWNGLWVHVGGAYRVEGKAALRTFLRVPGNVLHSRPALLCPLHASRGPSLAPIHI